MRRAGHLVATHEGGAGKRVFLLGHLDTVFEKASAVPVWDRHGDRVRGQGVNDMKGGDVVMIEALRALKTVGVLDQANVEIMFTGDEERTGMPLQTARAEMTAMGKRADYALSFEGSGKHDGADTASIARRSAGGWVLRVKGKAAHSMGVFSGQSGHGAIYETARISAAGRVVVAIRSGVVFELVAAAGVDRDIPTLKTVSSGNLRGTSATISFSESYPPMPSTEAGKKLAGLYSKASLDAGLGRIVARVQLRADDGEPIRAGTKFDALAPANALAPVPVIWPILGQGDRRDDLWRRRARADRQQRPLGGHRFGVGTGVHADLFGCGSCRLRHLRGERSTTPVSRCSRSADGSTRARDVRRPAPTAGATHHRVAAAVQSATSRAGPVSSRMCRPVSARSTM